MKALLTSISESVLYLWNYLGRTLSSTEFSFCFLHWSFPLDPEVSSVGQITMCWCMLPEELVFPYDQPTV